MQHNLSDIINRKHSRNLFVWRVSCASTWLFWGIAPAVICGFFAAGGLFDWFWLIPVFCSGVISAFVLVKPHTKTTLKETAKYLDFQSRISGCPCSSMVAIGSNYNNESLLIDEFLEKSKKHALVIEKIKIPLWTNILRILVVTCLLLTAQILVFLATSGNENNYTYKVKKPGSNWQVKAIDPDEFKNSIIDKLSLQELSQKTGKSVEELKAMLEEAKRQKEAMGKNGRKGSGTAKAVYKDGKSIDLYSGKISYSKKENIRLVPQITTMQPDSSGKIPPIYKAGVKKYLEALSSSSQP